MSIPIVDNFKYIAQNVAMIYYVLSNSDFGKNLTEDQLLYATAICDTMPYLNENKIYFNDIEEAVFCAKNGIVKINFYSVSHSIFDTIDNKLLAYFAMQLEAMIFTVDTNIDYHTVVDTVMGNKDKIINTINETLKQGVNCSLYNNIFNNVTAMLEYEDIRNIIYAYGSDNISSDSAKPQKTEIFFTHTCSHCGHTFKVKYKKPADKKEIPPLSVVCPKCKEKQTFKI